MELRGGRSRVDQTLPTLPRAEDRRWGGPGWVRVVEDPGGEGPHWSTLADLGGGGLVPSLPGAAFIAKLLSTRGSTGPGPGYLLLYVVYVCDI